MRHGERDIMNQTAEAFRLAGWNVAAEPKVGKHHADLAIHREGKAFLIEMKRVGESRADRAIPLLSQMILQARVIAREDPNGRQPMAVLVASHHSDALIRAAEDFAGEFAEDVAVGMVDESGLRLLVGPGLEPVRRSPDVSASRHPDPLPPSAGQLFSDLNQWLLKVMLAPNIAEEYLGAPRARYANASQLAASAKVSIMSAFRFLRQLGEEGFVEESPAGLQLVRMQKLLDGWSAASMRSAQDRPMRWAFPGDSDQQLYDALGEYQGEAESIAADNARGALHRPRACLGLFAAADALGLGFVHGVPAHVCMERVDSIALRRLGLVPAEQGSRPDVLVRRPPARESMFRACVRRRGVLVSDALQVWLDVGTHPSRGERQAAVIYDRVIEPLLKRAPA